MLGRALLVGDDDALTNAFAQKNVTLDCALNAGDARYFLEVRLYDLLIFVPKFFDLALVKFAKNRHKNCVAIVLADPKATPNDEIHAFKSGADDFCKKPLDFEAFFARVQTRLKRTENVISRGALQIFPDEGRVVFGENEIFMRGKPFAVLAYLASRDEIVSKEQLINSLWDEPELVTPNVIEVAVNEIRKNIDKCLQISTVATVRGRGYRFIGRGC